jgi:ribosomal protein L40E
MDCSICGADLHMDAMSCNACGAPTDDRAASGERSQCALCSDVLWSLAEACVHCGSKGYPALRPRLGDKSLGAPEEEISV